MKVSVFFICIIALVVCVVGCFYIPIFITQLLEKWEICKGKWFFFEAILGQLYKN